MKRLIAEYFGDQYDTAVRTFSCESGLRQWKNDGSVLRGIVTPADTGVTQINTDYWGDDAEVLGLDYENNIRHNVKMARYIYDNHGGWSNWYCSPVYVAYAQ